MNNFSIYYTNIALPYGSSVLCGCLYLLYTKFNKENEINNSLNSFNLGNVKLVIFRFKKEALKIKVDFREARISETDITKCLGTNTDDKINLRPQFESICPKLNTDTNLHCYQSRR